MHLPAVELSTSDAESPSLIGSWHVRCLSLLCASSAHRLCVARRTDRSIILSNVKRSRYPLIFLCRSEPSAHLDSIHSLPIFQCE